jgi:predicted transcriptional regulator
MSGDIMKLMYLLEGDRTAFEIAEALDMDFEPLLELLNKFYDRQLIAKERIPVEFDRAR